MAEVLIKHQNVFSKSPHDLGCTDLVEHEIVTWNAKPIEQRPYRISLSKKVEAEKEIKSMTERGIIEPSCSPWWAPIVMVTKKDGSIRFCCDFRRLNAETVKYCQPLPRIEDTLVAMSGSKWFRVNDMSSSFWQVKIKSSDIYKTAFSIEGGGFWQFRVMPFGTCNSSATFERLMEKALSGLTWKICLIYIDDIITFF